LRGRGKKLLSLAKEECLAGRKKGEGGKGRGKKSNRSVRGGGLPCTKPTELRQRREGAHNNRKGDGGRNLLKLHAKRILDRGKKRKKTLTFLSERKEDLSLLKKRLYTMGRRKGTRL